MVDWIALAGNVPFALVFACQIPSTLTLCRTQVRNGKAIMTGILCQFCATCRAFGRQHAESRYRHWNYTPLVVTSSPEDRTVTGFAPVFNGDLALSDHDGD
jgi:hypothetical protein